VHLVPVFEIYLMNWESFQEILGLLLGSIYDLVMKQFLLLYYAIYVNHVAERN